MKEATTFHSDFFNTDCVVVDGDPYFTVTGATKTLYPGSHNTARLMPQLAKAVGSETLPTTGDLGENSPLVGIEITNSRGYKKEALAFNQESFKLLLWEYQGKETKAGKYADKVLRHLVNVSMDLILRREAGLLDTKTAAQAIDESILRLKPDRAKAFSESPLQLLLVEAWRSYNAEPTADHQDIPTKHPTRFSSWFSQLLNQGIYSRVAPGIVKEARNRKGTTWQNLSDDVRQALVTPILMLTSNIKTHGFQNADVLIKEIDAYYPRYEQGYKRPRFS